MLEINDGQRNYKQVKFGMKEKSTRDTQLKYNIHHIKIKKLEFDFTLEHNIFHDNVAVAKA